MRGEGGNLVEHCLMEAESVIFSTIVLTLVLGFAKWAQKQGSLWYTRDGWGKAFSPVDVA